MTWVSMSRNRLGPEPDALDVDCPICAAKAGEPCWADGIGIRLPHMTRSTKAQTDCPHPVLYRLIQRYGPEDFCKRCKRYVPK